MKRMIALLLMLCLCGLTVPVWAAPYLLADAALAGLAQEDGEALAAQSPGQQRAAVVLLMLGFLSPDEILAGPTPEIVEAIRPLADGDELGAAAFWQWQSEREDLPEVMHLYGEDGLLHTAANDSIRLIVLGEDETWQVTTEPLYDVELPVGALFVYEYIGDDNTLVWGILRAPGGEEDGDEENWDDEAWDEEDEEEDELPETTEVPAAPLPDKRPCGHASTASGRHGRLPCGHYACSKIASHEAAACGQKRHYVCDKKQHGEGLCFTLATLAPGETPRPTPSPAPGLEACNKPKHTLGTPGDHTYHAACGGWFCAGAHVVPPCSNSNHCTLDGKQHGAALCGLDGHFVCDGKSHVLAACKVKGHCISGGGEHGAAVCGAAGHLLCDGKSHAVPPCGQPGHCTADGKKHGLRTCGDHYECDNTAHSPDGGDDW